MYPRGIFEMYQKGMMTWRTANENGKLKTETLFFTIVLIFIKLIKNLA
jgi:hypothetical protein